jgi:hypothetical protein
VYSPCVGVADGYLGVDSDKTRLPLLVLILGGRVQTEMNDLVGSDLNLVSKTGSLAKHLISSDLPQLQALPRRRLLPPWRCLLPLLRLGVR